MSKTRTFCAVLALATLLPSFAIAQQPIRWEATLDNAQRQAAQTNRLVMIYFWAPWCTVCQRMEGDVLGQAAVANVIGANYVPVKVNADYFPTIAQRYGVSGLPTTVIITAQGQMVDSMRGRLDANAFATRLTQVSANYRQQSSALAAQIPAGPAAAAVPAGTPGAILQNNPAPSNPAAQAGANPQISGPAAATNDRYADFFRRSQAANPAPTGQTTPQPNNTAPAMPQAGQANAPAATGPAQVYPSQPPRTASVMQVGQPGAPVNPAAPYGAQQQPANPATSNPTPQTPAIQPPLVLDGFCSVTLAEKQQWIPGDRRWGATHRGRTYLFAGPEEQKRFFADPDRYAPAISGNDIILALEQGRAVPGFRQHGVFFGNRIYLFSSEETLQKFTKNPQPYASQAMDIARTGTANGRALQ
jgi:thiol-disulfide isomerase/thioredoxin/YHS domain-containing protein